MADDICLCGGSKLFYRKWCSTDCEAKKAVSGLSMDFNNQHRFLPKNWSCPCGRVIQISQAQIDAGKKWCSSNCPKRREALRAFSQGAGGPGIQDHVRAILELLGAHEPDLLDLKNTPARVAKRLQEQLSGYSRSDQDLDQEMMVVPSDGSTRGVLVVEAGIPFSSLCAHHMSPFEGWANIGYVPGPKILGLSKPSRILDHFAARLQIQERLTAQVAGYISKLLNPEVVFVTLVAKHSCMSCRGIRKSIHTTTDVALPMQGPLEWQNFRGAVRDATRQH